jgi:EAL domain-containing protein (putative c-di-GMP-specific phosphodiesterase class I)
MSLVREVDQLPVKQRLVRSITSLCAEMGIEVVGEGVETTAERDALIELGCGLLQGYYFSRPELPFPTFRW